MSNSEWKDAELLFIAAYFRAVAEHPWADSAEAQAIGGNQRLLNDVKHRALEQACNEVGISRAEGIRAMKRFFAEFEDTDRGGP
jgi:hypothetical protein